MKTTALLHSTILAVLTFGGWSASAQTVTVTDNFNTSYDYTSGTGGDPFFSGQQFNGGGATLQAANSNNTTPGMLTVTSTLGRWQGGDDNGFLLYRNVTGNFTATIQLSVPYIAYNTAGLMARNPSLTNGENWIGAQLFGAYGNGPSQRNTVNSSGVDISSGNNYTSGYLELTRVGSLFTTLYSSDGTTYQVIGTATRTDLPATLEVGLYQGTFSTYTGTATFDNFSITTAVPEPSTWAAVLGGVGGLALLQARRRKTAVCR